MLKQPQHAPLPAAVLLSTAWLCQPRQHNSLFWKLFTLRLMSASVVNTMNLPKMLFQEKPGKENLHSQMQDTISSQLLQAQWQAVPCQPDSQRQLPPAPLAMHACITQCNSSKQRS